MYILNSLFITFYLGLPAYWLNKQQNNKALNNLLPKIST